MIMTNLISECNTFTILPWYDWFDGDEDTKKEKNNKNWNCKWIRGYIVIFIVKISLSGSLLSI